MAERAKRTIRPADCQLVYVIVAVIAVFAALWALTIWLVGGFTVAVAGVTVQSHDPARPLVLALIATALYVVIRGPGQLRNVRDVRGVATSLALLIALCPAIAGIARNSWSAGGADSHAYVSQAELWLASQLRVPVTLAAGAPWPDAVHTFAPHGFRPATSGAVLVPVTAPGLPLAMAAAKRIAGHCAMFLVTPLSAVLLVWMTFLCGRRLHSDLLGLSAAWLVATSPAMLAMLVSPMSDVPAAAMWITAIYFTLGSSTRSGWLAGFAASGAILIRPNLVPIAAVLVVWRWWAQRRGAVQIAAGVLPGCLAIAAVNSALYGSPLASGYGSLGALFSVSHVVPNLQRYGRWLIESQTPLAAAGILVLFWPGGTLWPSREQRQAALLLAATVAVVWCAYLAYLPYDAWWFLRFLLPSWPAMCLGAGALILTIGDSRNVFRRGLAICLLAGVGIYSLRYAAQNGAFPTGEGEHRYVSIAKMVEAATDPEGVIVTAQHAGPIRYYAGRTIVRFDVLDPAWLDRTVQWLSEQGRRPYFLLEDWEVPLFEERFQGSRFVPMTLAPIVEYRAPGVPGSIYLFDPLQPNGPLVSTTPPASARAKCVPPTPLLHWR